MKNKIISPGEAAALIKSGSTVMIGGFLGNANPEKIIDEIVESGVSGLTLIANDTAMPGVGISKLIASKKISRLLVSHIGTNPETGVQMSQGELDVELVPQGTLIERIRSGGYGLGGVLTPTGLGTDVQKGKPVLTVEGREYLLETPLRADVAVVQGAIVDKMGNVYYKGSSRNFCPYICMAADTIIVEAEKIVEPGQIRPEDVHTACILVDYIVEGGARA